MSTIEPNRAEILAQTNANARIEGFEPDESDKAMQLLFRAGDVDADDLLEEAHAFAEQNRGAP